MGNRTMIWLVGLVFGLIAVFNEAGTVAAVIWAATAILVSIHHLEVKINRLLDDRGITVTQADLRD